jgi:hypothetical protein
MRRYLIVLTTLAALAAVAVPALAASRVNVPREFSSKLSTVKSKSDIPVRLPTRVSSPRPASEVYGTVERVRDGRYHLALGVGRGCHEATACFIASFFAQRGMAPDPDLRRVDLARGIVGRYRPIRCGASCAAAAVQWRQGGVAYEIQYKGKRRQMVRLANSAINAGPR